MIAIRIPQDLSSCGDSAAVIRKDQIYSAPFVGTEALNFTGHHYADGTKPGLLSPKEIIQMTTIKTLKVQAKELGVVGYSKMNKETLIAAIEFYTPAPQMYICKYCSFNETEFNICKECVDQMAEEYQAASEASGPVTSINPNDVEVTATTTNLIEYVDADNLTVRFKYEGILNIIGWSKKDFRFHHYNTETKVSRITSYNSEIRNFKNLKNGVHGDVARVVKALARIKSMPAAIKLAERKSKQSNDPSHVSVSNVSHRRGTVDVNLMNSFVGTYAEAMQMTEAEVRKQGLLIRNFMNAYNDANVSSADENEFVIDYVTNIYNETVNVQ